MKCTSLYKRKTNTHAKEKNAGVYALEIISMHNYGYIYVEITAERVKVMKLSER